jgi:hypothetical protein
MVESRDNKFKYWMDGRLVFDYGHVLGSKNGIPSGVEARKIRFAIKTILYNRILNHTSVSYANVWSAYSTTDRQPNGKVWDIYSTRFDTSSPYEYNMGSDQCGTYAIEGDCYNREHSFPQSWFASNTPMQTDIHHLFASDGKVNGIRNNYPFGNVSAPTFTSLYGGKLGTGANFGYTGIVFEPIEIPPAHPKYPCVPREE